MGKHFYCANPEDLQKYPCSDVELLRQGAQKTINSRYKPVEMNRVKSESHARCMMVRKVKCIWPAATYVTLSLPITVATFTSGVVWLNPKFPGLIPWARYWAPTQGHHSGGRRGVITLLRAHDWQAKTFFSNLLLLRGSVRKLFFFTGPQMPEIAPGADTSVSMSCQWAIPADFER